MTAAKRLPLPKRFPNQWSTKFTLYTDKGSKIEGEGPLSPEAGRLMLACFVAREPTANQLARMAALSEELMPDTSAKRSAK